MWPARCHALCVRCAGFPCCGGPLVLLCQPSHARRQPLRDCVCGRFAFLPVTMTTVFDGVAVFAPFSLITRVVMLPAPQNVLRMSKPPLPLLPPPTTRGKRILVVCAMWTKYHSVYRNFQAFVEVLKRDYEVWFGSGKSGKACAGAVVQRAASRCRAVGRPAGLHPFPLSWAGRVRVARGRTPETRATPRVPPPRPRPPSR